jgi:alpha-L-rhamnosidase
MSCQRSSARANHIRGLFFIFSGLIATVPSAAQTVPVNPVLLHQGWAANWITDPGSSATEYSVCHFRKSFSVSAVPPHFIIHVSADNRYVLYVNGQRVGRGPAGGDLYQWNYESYDIASLLKTGNNLLAAEVWNLGTYGPVAQISSRLGFLLQGDGHPEQIVNTNASWKVIHDKAYRPCATGLGPELGVYIVSGPGDRVDGQYFPWGWYLPDFQDSSWSRAETVDAGAVPFGSGTDNLWTLVPSTIPQMEESPQRLECIRRSGFLQVKDSFNLGKHPLYIPANDSVTILLDQGFETVSYPLLEVSGGKGAQVKLTYAEALTDPEGQKGNRNEITGRSIRGLYDIFLPDGGTFRQFSPLWIRTYRYLQLDIHTGFQPLIIDDLLGMYTGYPFRHRAAFSSDDSSLEKIWEVGWRTARLCAGETYFDCPYYEQLQYEADTRIQSLISLYNSGDDRLMRKALHDFFDSRVPSGLTQGRFPSRRLQVIPTFSLLWISMLHDYWMNRTDDALLRQYLGAMNDILDWYRGHLDTMMHMLGPMNWWNFVDWNNAFPDGVPDGAREGHSSVITLQLAYTLNQAADLLRYFHRYREADADAALAGQLDRAVYALCFDKTKMEMANTPDKKTFSQHAGIMAILAGAIPDAELKGVMDQILNDSSLSQATFYYRFYLTRALVKCGMADLYYSQLGPWRDMIARGLTTFAENPEPTRSDCHGWSASPEYDFLATICGIMPARPGFREVRIAPAFGGLHEIRAVMPHPDGEIRLYLHRQHGDGVAGDITLPASLSGTFIWHGKTVALHGGLQHIGL